MHIHPLLFYLSLSLSFALGFFFAAAFRAGRDDSTEQQNMACSNNIPPLPETECPTESLANNLADITRYCQGRDQIRDFKTHDDGYSFALGLSTFHVRGTPPKWIRDGVVVLYKSTPETGLMMILDRAVTAAKN